MKKWSDFFLRGRSDIWSLRDQKKRRIVLHYKVASQTEQIKFGLRLNLRSNLRTKREFLSETKDETKLLSSLKNLYTLVLSLRPKFRLCFISLIFLLKLPTACREGGISCQPLRRRSSSICINLTALVAPSSRRSTNWWPGVLRRCSAHPEQFAI